MAGLKKIKSASLVENLFASALLIIIFTMATASLHYFFQKSFKKDTRNMWVDFEKNYYQFSNGKIDLPLQYKKNNLHYHFHTRDEEGIPSFGLIVKDNAQTVKLNIHREVQNIP